MIEAFRQYFSLCGGLLYWLIVAPFRGRPWRIGHTFAQIVRIGVHAVPMSALTALTIGVVLAMQSAAQLAKLGATVYVPGLVSSSLIRELAPLVTAVIVIGRSGSSVTAELGTMKVSEEIEALEVMAIPPMSYLIVPRFLAMVIMMPLLAVFSIYVGLAGGWLISHFSLHMSTAFYVNHALQYVELRDVGIGLLKSGVFGVLIVTIACSIGLNVSGGAEGVGLATTRSVVVSLLSVFIANAALTAVFFF
ncbi:ABC transporter permease [Prosthecobacter sp.]|uniref:MlaE family ABC transporter permease n=1 Tax=Prosthecobacter sp. TaxID=1965333 RepID=UPI001DF6C711|nr:ABC transporter permease [Prosthecobacter sp.]MCB1277128.1 ABC transporter permease [Prosthecobacter sp.]